MSTIRLLKNLKKKGKTKRETKLNPEGKKKKKTGIGKRIEF